MSYDIQLGWPCPHVIGEERVRLDTDRMTIRTNKPIAGPGILKLVANDKFEIAPSLGLQSSAVLTASKPQPYLVSPGSRDFIIQTQERHLSLELPIGYLTADQVAAQINAAVANPNERPFLIASVNNGVLSLRENLTLGSNSQVRVQGGAIGGVGFVDQVGAVGQVVLPPFHLFNRTLRSEDGLIEEGYFLRFDRPVRANYNLSVTYQVFWNQCLRCRGTEVENDFRYQQGHLALVRDDNLLYQSCLKILLTELKSNIYASWYGTPLMSMIGSKSSAATSMQIQQACRQALQNLQNLQNLQSKYQRITARERLYAVDHVGVQQAQDDPTVFLVDVQVRSYTFDPVQITIVYTAPGAYALKGTNRLSLGNFGR